LVRTALPNYNIIMDILLRISTSDQLIGFTVVYTNQMKNAKVKQCPTKSYEVNGSTCNQTKPTKLAAEQLECDNNLTN